MTDLRKLSIQLIDAEAIDRKRIADMLHDDLQQHLIALKFRIWNLIPPDLIDENMTRRLALFEQIIDESIQKSREISYELNPPVLHQKGFLPALQWLAADMEERYGLKTALRLDTDIEPDAPGLAFILFHSIKELLQNVVRHSGSQTAVVDAQPDGNAIRIRVADSGKGFDPITDLKPKKPPRFGLSNIKKRIGCSGGRIDIESTPGKGCCVTLHIPDECFRS